MAEDCLPDAVPFAQRSLLRSEYGEFAVGLWVNGNPIDLATKLNKVSHEHHMHFCALLSYHFASCNPNPNQTSLKIIEVLLITAGACGTHVLPHAMKINEAVGMSGK